MIHTWVKIGFLFGFGILLYSCKTSDGRVTKFGKAYHNLTGRYNAYYHAGLKLDKAFQTVNDQYKDDYTKLLTLYPYCANQDTNSVKSLADEVIKKTVFNIELHRPSNWTDDSYLYLGRIEFLQKKYPKAEATFKYILDKYNPDKPKSAMSKEELAELAAKQKKANKTKKKTSSKSKKRKSSSKKKKPAPKPSPKPNPSPDPEPLTAEQKAAQKPDKKFLKHLPNRHASMLWYAKACIENKDYDDAGLYLRLLEEDGKTPYKLRGEVQAVMAHMYIQQELYPNAIERLEKAIPKTKKKYRARYAYVLAQLYDKAGNFAEAENNYKKVVKSRPNYEMEFNAKLNMAKTGARSSQGNPELALNRMVRDPKNEEYKDQIYFAMAEIQLRKGNKPEGIQLLRQAMDANKGGSQKTEASILLAELYDNSQDYVNAYLYYDTTAQSMDKKDARLAKVDTRRRQLELFAKSSMDLAAQDSALTISNWDFEKQKEYVKKLKNKQIVADNKKSKKPKTAEPEPTGKLSIKQMGATSTAGAEKQNPTTNPPKPTNPNSKSEEGLPTIVEAAVNASNFLLYNPTQQKKGERDFEKRWGTRAYADNWVRSKRAGATQNLSGADAEAAAALPMTESDVKDFLAQSGVPQDSASKKALEAKIATSMHGIAQAYREQMEMKDKSIEAYERLLSRFPNCKEAPDAWYSLYNLYKEKGNASKAEFCKNQLVAKSPNSELAQAAQNPNFLNANQQKEKELNNFYQETYEFVKNRAWESAKQKINEARTKYASAKNYTPRFAMLEAMCVGGTEGELAYIKALQTISNSFPNTPEDRRAKEIVAALGKTSPLSGANNNPNINPNTNPTANTEDAGNIFNPDISGTHQVLVIYDGKKMNQNELNVAISTYNTTNYRDARFNVMSTPLGDMNSFLIRRFNNGQEAYAYANAMLNAKEMSADKTGVQQVIAMSYKNYQIFFDKIVLKDKKIYQQYLNFYQKTYK